MLDSTNLIRSIRFEGDPGAAGGDPNAGKGGGNPTEFPGWMAQLSDDDKENADFAQFKTLPEFAASYKDLAERAGKYEPAPEDPKEYELALPDKPPEGFEEDETVKTAFREFAKANNLTKAQAKEAYSWFNKIIFDQFSTVQKQIEEQKTKALDKLKADWGDEFDAKSDLAQRALNKFGSPELAAAFKASGFYTNPEVIKTFAEIGAAIGEDQLEPGAGGEVDTRAGYLNELYPSMKDFPKRTEF